MEDCIKQYNELLLCFEKLLKLPIKDISEMDDTMKQNNMINFYNSLNDEKIFLLFSKSKIKVFSAKTNETHHVSSSLFNDELSLKHLFNNQTDLVKSQLWEKLFLLYLDIDSTMPTSNIEHVEILRKNIEMHKNDLSNKVKNDILKIDVNNTTNNMIDDIVGSFQNIIHNKANPFDNIMNITNMISDKYKDQLQNGEIQLDKIIGGIDGVIPGLMKNTTDKKEKEKETVIIDENFSTADVDIGKEEESKNNIGNMMKMIPNMTGLVNMVNRINTAENDDDLIDIKKDMDIFLEKDLKVDMTQFNETMSKIEKNMNIKQENLD
jgi:hypothetical protein